MLILPPPRKLAVSRSIGIKPGMLLPVGRRIVGL